jgi:hypothetical protein
MNAPDPNGPTADTTVPRTKGAGPLYVLAGMAFIPLLGILLGAIGLTWGLVSSRPRALRAGIIAGAGAMLNLVGLIVLSIFIARGDEDLYASARETATRRDLLTLVREIEEYHEENDEYPPSLTALQTRPAVFRTINIYDQTAGVLTPRVYSYERSRDGSNYDLFSRGVDGEPGTPDDIRPALPDSLAARAGYRPATPPERDE